MHKNCRVTIPLGNVLYAICADDSHYLYQMSIFALSQQGKDITSLSLSLLQSKLLMNLSFYIDRAIPAGLKYVPHHDKRCAAFL
jgi:hypothetical protein